MALAWLVRRRQAKLAHEGRHDNGASRVDGLLELGVVPHLGISSVRCLILEDKLLALVVEHHQRLGHPRREGIRTNLVLVGAVAPRLSKRTSATVEQLPSAIRAA